MLDSFTPEESNLKPLPNLGELGVANDFQNFFMLHFDNKETVYVSCPFQNYFTVFITACC